MLFKLGIAAAILSFGVVTMLGVAIHHAGFIVVDVQNKAKGERVFVPVPMLFVNLALDVVPDQRLARLSARLQDKDEWLAALTRELSECPDGTFVEIESREDQVSVAKKGGNILIDVNSSEEEVHLRFPIRSTAKAFTRLAEINAQNSAEF